ncbi:MAG: calcium-translocating P-type ATPase, SERCA-type, partial [Nanoarchaeota archaeon]|nr:calcium-translocating P-type ATPase, SERCA-type [Nanoarchaeota archaeon]
NRLAKYGPNQLKAEKKESPLMMLLEQFNSPVIWVLIGAVIISGLLAEWIDATVILIILILNAILGFLQEYRAEKAIEALKKLAGLKAVVMRDGHEIKIDATELVPGDIIILETGEKVPADARLIDAINLEVQEAVLTGESAPVQKENIVLQKDKTFAVADMINMIFSSTIITRGRGKAVVTSTGMETQVGKIAHMLTTQTETQTPLQKQLEHLGKWLGIITLVICAIVFLVGIMLKQGTVLEILLVAVSLAVAAIPEGLPAVVTISLSLGVQRMIKRNALMRHLPSVETLGCTTVICSDKTGTLTHNQMTVVKIFSNNKEVSVSGRGYKPEGSFSIDSKEISLLLRIGAQNNDAKLNREKWEVIGDPTEGCLITSALKAKLDKEELDKRYPRIDEIPFDSERKLMTTVHKGEKSNMILTKGALDNLLDKCGFILLNGERKMLSSQMKKELLAKNEEYASQALRVLGFAYKEVPFSQKLDKKKYESDLVFVGIQCMIDPPRKEAKEAIARCHEAGIKVVMITGDHKTTAMAIAKELGIIGKVITGQELEALSDEELTRDVEQIAIYARVNPEHKLKIIKALEANKHIVAMTGDGVNDAPALKKAHLGIAMGIAGTDVAKEASDMILTDDNFKSIVDAIEEGRNIYDNIRKFVNYLLRANLGEVLTIFVASLAGFPLPLFAIHLLWVNLITDGLPAVALAMDPPAPGIMKRPPRSVKSKIISPKMDVVIVLGGILVALLTLGIFRYSLSVYDETTARTIGFTALVLGEFAMIHLVRSDYQTKLFSNKWLWMAVGTSLALHLAVLYTPLHTFFKAVPLTLAHWGLILGSITAMMIVGMIAYRIIRIVVPKED